MARRNSTDEPAAEVVETEAQVDEAPAGELDVEAWVAAVYDYQHNGGPKPPVEPLHVDALGTVLPVERDGDEAETEA